MQSVVRQRGQAVDQDREDEVDVEAMKHASELVVSVEIDEGRAGLPAGARSTAPLDAAWAHGAYPAITGATPVWKSTSEFMPASRRLNRKPARTAASSGMVGVGDWRLVHDGLRARKCYVKHSRRRPSDLMSGRLFPHLPEPPAAQATSIGPLPTGSARSRGQPPDAPP